MSFCFDCARFSSRPLTCNVTIFILNSVRTHTCDSTHSSQAEISQRKCRTVLGHLFTQILASTPPMCTARPRLPSARGGALLRPRCSLRSHRSARALVARRLTRSFRNVLMAPHRLRHGLTGRISNTSKRLPTTAALHLRRGCKARTAHFSPGGHRRRDDTRGRSQRFTEPSLAKPRKRRRRRRQASCAVLPAAEKYSAPAAGT